MKQRKKNQIRDWEIADLERYLFWNTGNQEWMNFDGPYYPKLSKPELDKKIDQYKKQILTKKWETPRQRLVIADVKENQLLGIVSWYWQSKETNWKSIGIVIYDDSYWSKGIGFEALQLWMNYLFELNPKLIRLDLRTWSGNQGMIQLAKKLGFIEEARFRKARIVKGVYFDSIGMGILREEWENRL